MDGPDLVAGRWATLPHRSASLLKGRANMNTASIASRAPVRPAARPPRAEFSSGPCAKRPGYSLSALGGALLGGSHRAAGPKAALADVVPRPPASAATPSG